MRIARLAALAVLLTAATGCQSVLANSIGVMAIGKNYREADFGTATGYGVFYEMTLLELLDVGYSYTRAVNDVDDKRLSVYGLLRVPLASVLSLRIGGGPVYEAITSQVVGDLVMDSALGFEGRASVVMSLMEMVKAEAGIIATLSDTTATTGGANSVTLNQWMIFMGMSIGF